MDSRYGGWRSMRDGDFQEADVWAVLNDTTEHSSNYTKPGTTSTSRRLPTNSAARMIPRASNPVHEPKVVQQSAPVNIPDWSKIYGNNSRKASKKNSSWLNDDDDDDGNDSGDDDDDDEYEEDDEYDSKVPPHELLARRVARSQISSFSVCEGVGRTLKGRDLSKLRNAVLTRTGFLE